MSHVQRKRGERKARAAHVSFCHETPHSTFRTLAPKVLFLVLRRILMRGRRAGHSLLQCCFRPLGFVYVPFLFWEGVSDFFGAVSDSAPKRQALKKRAPRAGARARGRCAPPAAARHQGPDRDGNYSYGRHRLNGYLAQRVPSLSLASGFRMRLICEVLKGMFPWRTRYPLSQVPIKPVPI